MTKASNLFDELVIRVGHIKCAEDVAKHLALLYYKTNDPRNEVLRISCFVPAGCPPKVKLVFQAIGTFAERATERTEDEMDLFDMSDTPLLTALKMGKDGKGGFIAAMNPEVLTDEHVEAAKVMSGGPAVTTLTFTSRVKAKQWELESRIRAKEISDFGMPIIGLVCSVKGELSA